MKRTLQLSLAAAILLVILLLLMLTGRKADDARRQTACTALEVKILDTARLGFVSAEDVKAILDKEYGVFIGQRLDSVDLSRIETILNGRSAIRQSEAYATQDGVLHVEVAQRDPLVRFKTPQGGFYADATGYLFPLASKYTSPVTVIEGETPISADNAFKGLPKTQAERDWLAGIIQLLGYIDGNKAWNGAFRSIRTDKKGEVVLQPVTGREHFLFGLPEDIPGKFARMENYYKYIAPSKEEGYYGSVNVKYSGQIICRKK